MGSGIGFDRYGREQFALRAIYSVTPAFDLRAVVSPAWTADKVDTDGTRRRFGSAHARPCLRHPHGQLCGQPQGAGCNGDSNYLGTEVEPGHHLAVRARPDLRPGRRACCSRASALDAPRPQRRPDEEGRQERLHVASRVRYSF